MVGKVCQPMSNSPYVPSRDSLNDSEGSISVTQVYANGATDIFVRQRIMI